GIARVIGGLVITAGWRSRIAGSFALDLIELGVRGERRAAKELAPETRRGMPIARGLRRHRRGGTTPTVTAEFGKRIALPDQPGQLGKRIAAGTGTRRRTRHLVRLTARDRVIRAIWSLA